MQLKSKGAIGAALASATAGLLGGLPVEAIAANEVSALDSPWTVDSALLYYGESDGRVRDLSLKSIIQRIFDNDRSLNINFSVDSLTGASPTGAVTSDSAQTFTRPSGRDAYRIGPGQLPLDDTFHDTRLALAGDWLQPIGDASRINVGIGFSNETDYLHLGVNIRAELDFNQRNTTAFLGAAYGDERINPVGGTPVPLTAMQAAGSVSGKLDSDSKTVIDGIVGLTQVLSRRALVSMTYSYSSQDGYLNDAYKVVSVVDPTTGRPVAGPIPGLGRHLYERRPDSRAKHSVFGEWRYALDRDSFAVSYRLLTDDWGIDSHTLDAHYRWNLSRGSYLEPQARFYKQSAADFYRSYLIDGQPLPEFASADYRLAAMRATTVGLKYGQRTRFGEFAARLEYYRQATRSDDPKIGVLANYDLVPPFSAVFVQIGYKFKL